MTTAEDKYDYFINLPTCATHITKLYIKWLMGKLFRIYLKA